MGAARMLTRVGSFAPLGLTPHMLASHGLRRGLHSFAALRLRSGQAFAAKNMWLPNARKS